MSQEAGTKPTHEEHDEHGQHNEHSQPLGQSHQPDQQPNGQEQREINEHEDSNPHPHADNVKQEEQHVGIDDEQADLQANKVEDQQAGGEELDVASNKQVFNEQDLQLQANIDPTAQEQQALVHEDGQQHAEEAITAERGEDQAEYGEQVFEEGGLPVNQEDLEVEMMKIQEEELERINGPLDQLVEPNPNEDKIGHEETEELKQGHAKEQGIDKGEQILEQPSHPEDFYAEPSEILAEQDESKKLIIAQQEEETEEAKPVIKAASPQKYEQRTEEPVRQESQEARYVEKDETLKDQSVLLGPTEDTEREIEQKKKQPQTTSPVREYEDEQIKSTIPLTPIQRQQAAQFFQQKRVEEPARQVVTEKKRKQEKGDGKKDEKKEKKEKKSKKQKIRQQKIEEIQPVVPVTVGRQLEEPGQESAEKKQKKEKKDKKEKKSKQMTEDDGDDHNRKKSNTEIGRVSGEEPIVVEKASSNPVLPPPPPAPTAGMIIKEAQRERITTTLSLFQQYMNIHTKHVSSQMAVLNSIDEGVDRKKKDKYMYYYVLMEYYVQYQKLAKDFHERCYKVSGQKEEQLQKNKLINMCQELKEGLDQLVFLKKETGNDFHRLHDFLESKVTKELENSFNKYINTLNKAQSELSEKKKECMDKYDEFKKKAWKLIKIYNRGRAGKSHNNEDVFVETIKQIKLERVFRASLINWGQGLSALRKQLLKSDELFSQEIQTQLNSIKNVSNTIYTIHRSRYDQIVSIHEQASEQVRSSNLCALAEKDYIKYALEVVAKKEILEITDRNFEYFVEMPHLEILTGAPTDLLKGMVNKIFTLRNQSQELINTISGNLVVYNSSQTSYGEIFCIKNIQAKIVEEGVIQIDERIPGFIFDSNRTARLEFLDEDRAEELICFLSEKEKILQEEQPANE